MKITFALLLLAGAALGQQGAARAQARPVFDWQQVHAAGSDMAPSTIRRIGPLKPDRDNDRLRVLLSSRTPVTISFLPADLVAQLFAPNPAPELADRILAQNKCVQQNVSEADFTCSFNRADGPYTMLVLDLRPAAQAQMNGALVEAGIRIAVRVFAGMKLPSGVQADTDPNHVRVQLLEWKCAHNCPSAK